MTHSDKFLQKTRQQLDDSIEQLDAATLSRLNRARQNALQCSRQNKVFRATWIPVSLTAALSLAIVAQWLWYEQPATETIATQQQISFDDLELISSNAEFELLEELEFISWLVVEENAG